MSRITDKSIRPIPQPGESRVREQPQQREAPVPPGARVASTTLTTLQRAQNQQLIALYHSLTKEVKSSHSTNPEVEARLKGWKRRPSNKKKRQHQQPEDESGGENRGGENRRGDESEDKGRDD